MFRHRTGRIVGTLLTLLFLIIGALPALALVIRGVPGSIHTVETVAVESAYVGLTCDVTTEVVNGESAHIDNQLRIGNSAFEDVEGRANSTETFTATVTMTNPLLIQVRLSPVAELPPIPAYPEGRSIWSADTETTYTCDTDTTTTSAPSSTTTSSVPQVTTTTEGTTTTSQPPSSSTTAPSTSTSTSVPDVSYPRAVVDCSDDQIVVTGLWEGEWVVSDNRDHVWEFRVDDPSRVYRFALIDNPTRVSLIGELNGERYTQTVAIDCEGPVTSTTSTTVPPITGSTLPFTGPEDMGGWAMAGAALFLLGSALVLALRQNEGVHTQ